MASKPESTFTSSVHKHLPLKLYREKMHNPYRGGTWDLWYSGDKADLWVEYKFLVLPKRPDTMIEFGLSPLQLKWGADRRAEGRNVAVIVGCKEGGVILEGKGWETPLACAEFRERLSSRFDVAQWIARKTVK